MEVGSVTAIKEMVLLNLGVAVLAPWVVEKELARGILQMRPIGSRPLRRRWVITHLATKRLNLAETRFCRLCRNQATALRKDRRELPGHEVDE
jgi:DNA-binding transcriptional LysR family regulator